MARIDNTFERLKREGRKALNIFVMAGDPDANKSAAILESLPESGADIIELGLPFTDPMADGPAVQASGLRALGAGMNYKSALKMLQQFRSKNAETPVILMGYFNPVLAYGPAKFAQDAAVAGADGLIIVDLPPEEAGEITPHVEKAGLALIRLVTPTTDDKRLPTVLDGASGFLYYVSITGVTGTASANAEDVGAHIARIKKKTDLPVVVGFGIKNAEDAKAMGQIADGVVVGSAIVKNIDKYENDNTLVDQINTQIKTLKQAL